MKLLTLNPIAFVNSGPSYCCASISAGLDRALPDHRTFLLRSRTNPPCRTVLPRRSRVLNEVLYRWRRPALRAELEEHFVREAERVARQSSEPVVAPLWPAASVDVARRLRDAGIRTAAQMINTHVGYAKRILDGEHAAIGMPNLSAIPEAAIGREIDFLRTVDLILAPSTPVAESLGIAGIPDGKVRHAPFGWDPGRFGQRVGEGRATAEFTALFVGFVCVRKGAHLLLQAWAESGIRGRLLLCGHIEPTIARRFGDLLRRPDVSTIPFTRRIEAVYRKADAFVFPTLEEGAPLVSYEAAGLGLPILTSAMGACDVVQDGGNGFVLDPHDNGAWVEKLRQLATSRELRAEFGAASRTLGAHYTWENAAASRLAHFGALAAG